MKISMKRRKIGYTYGSVSGRYPFRNEKSIAFESTLERDLLTLLEFQGSVTDVIEQPVTIEYINKNGNKTTYTPDFLVYFKFSPAKGIETPFPRPMLIEVKPRDRLINDFAKLKEKFKVGMRYAKENGFSFKIYDETRIHRQDFKNIKFLSRYLSPIYDKYEINRIYRHVMVLGHTTVEYILLYLYVTEVQRGMALSIIWHMLAIKSLGSDLCLPLSQDTVVWVNNDNPFEFGEYDEYEQ